MHRSTYRSLLLAGAAALGIGGLAQSASAVGIAPNSGDYEVIESCVVSSGCFGTFDVINNSSSDPWYVYAFDVVNSPAYSIGTTQTHWSTCYSTTATGSCTGSGGFRYYNTNGSATSDLTNDVGPGQSSDLFTFGSLAPSSPVTLLLVNSSGGTSSVTITASDVIPEPVGLTVLGTGLFGLYGARRRRRARGG